MGKTFSMPSKTQQHFRDQVDINSIVDRFASGDQVVLGPELPFGDQAAMLTLEQSLEVTARATEYLEQLPIEAQKAVDYNPLNLMEALQDPDQARQLAELGVPISGIPEPEVAPSGEGSPEAAESPQPVAAAAAGTSTPGETPEA